MRNTCGSAIESLVASDWHDLPLPDAERASWCGLVEEIAELEELLADLSADRDVPASGLVDRLERLLESKRRALRAVDVG